MKKNKKMLSAHIMSNNLNNIENLKFHVLSNVMFQEQEELFLREQQINSFQNNQKNVDQHIGSRNQHLEKEFRPIHEFYIK